MRCPINIEDIKLEVECPGEVIPTIFRHQKELMLKYEEIESKNGICVPLKPWSLDDRRVQYRLKDFFWRFTEELAEAAEEFILHPESFRGLQNWELEWAKNGAVRHFFEEIVDALHFLTEASIIAELDAFAIDEDLKHVLRASPKDGTILMNTDQHQDALLHSVNRLFFPTIRTLGLAANCLKNKPWKVSEMATDTTKFRFILYDAWTEFFKMWATLGGSDKMLYILYAKKNLVNQWRQETLY